MQSPILRLQQRNTLPRNLKELLQSFRGQFARVWREATDDAEKFGLTEPELARLRRAPRDVSMRDQQNMCCPEDYSRQRYICHLLIQLLLRSKAGSNLKEDFSDINFVLSSML